MFALGSMITTTVVPNGYSNNRLRLLIQTTASFDFDSSIRTFSVIITITVLIFILSFYIFFASCFPILSLLVLYAEARSDGG